MLITFAKNRIYYKYDYNNLPTSAWKAVLLRTLSCLLGKSGRFCCRRLRYAYLRLWKFGFSSLF